MFNVSYVKVVGPVPEAEDVLVDRVVEEELAVEDDNPVELVVVKDEPPVKVELEEEVAV